MKINPINNFNEGYKESRKKPFVKRDFVGFGAEKIEHDKENPISKTMERLDLMKGAIIAGLGFGARALFEWDVDGEMFGNFLKMGRRMANKKYAHLNKYLRAGLGIASGVAIITGAIGIIGGLYAISQTPKAMYQGKINAHKKSEEMDVYLAQNRIEQDLYKEVSNSAKSAQTKEDLSHAEKQYFLLKQAKTQIPGFVQNM